MDDVCSDSFIFNPARNWFVVLLLVNNFGDRKNKKTKLVTELSFRTATRQVVTLALKKKNGCDCCVSASIFTEV